MKGFGLLLVVGVFLLTMTGCVSNMFPGGPTPAGYIVTNVTAPSQALAVAVDPAAKATKKGSATSGAVLGLIAFGDSSVNAAMADAGITKVHHVDYNINSILGGIWLGMTTIVYGE